MKFLYTNFRILTIDEPAKGSDGGGEGKEPPKTPANLKDVIKDAADKTAMELAKEEPSQKEEEEKKEEEPKKEEVKKEEEEELTEDQSKFVKNLYKGLNNKDPKIQIATLRLLANAAGMDLAEVKTEKQSEKAEETLLELLKAGLGEYDFLADKLAPVLEKALDKHIEKHTKEIKDEIKADKQAKQLESIQNEFSQAAAEYENSGELMKDVSVLMDQFKPSNKVSPKDYFKSLLVIAANNKNITLKLVGKNKQESDRRIESNRNDANSRLASERNAEVKDTTRVSSFKNLKEAVKDAAEKAAEELARK